jgi:hypothetical protein
MPARLLSGGLLLLALSGSSLERNHQPPPAAPQPIARATPAQLTAGVGRELSHITWKLHQTTDNISVYFGYGGYPLAYRSTTRLSPQEVASRGLSIEKLATALTDGDTMPQWLTSLKHVRHIEDATFYFINAAPAPLDDRDGLLSAQAYLSTSQRSLRLDFCALDQPVTTFRSGSAVQITQLAGRWFFRMTPDGALEADYQVATDPGIHPPKALESLFNALTLRFQADTPRLALQGLLKTVAAPTYSARSIPDLVEKKGLILQ